MPEEMVVAIGPDEARLNVTWSGQNADLPSPVPFNASNEEVKLWATEAVRNGTPGLLADPNVNFTDFIVERMDPTEQRPHNLLMLRPKTPFGG